MAYPKMGEITDKFVGQPYDLNSVLSPAKVWEKLDAQSEEVRVFVNSLIDLLNSTGEDNWLYTAIVNAILGQITDGSLTDVKLSDEAGQIKDRLTAFIATYDAFVGVYNAFVATKGVANGIASLDANGKIPTTQMPIMIRGASTKTASFPIRTGTDPYVYTYVTVSIPITESADEVDIEVGESQLKLFRGLNYAVLTNYDISGDVASVPRIIPVNKGLGETGSTFAAILNTGGTFFSSSSIKVVDTYISGGNVILKCANEFTTVANNVSQSFEYIARG